MATLEELRKQQEELAKKIAEAEKAEANAAVERIEAEIQTLNETYEKKKQPLRDKLIALDREQADAAKDLNAQLRKARGRAGVGLKEIMRKGSAKRNAAGTRAPRGHNQRLILEALKTTPGMSAKEVASATGIAETTVTPTVFTMTKNGLLAKKKSKDGTKLSITASGEARLRSL